MVTEVGTPTGLVETVKDALVDPAGTVTFGGTPATSVFPLVSVMIAPPVGAGDVRVAVPCDTVPPTTAVGLTLIDDSAKVGITVSVAVAVAP
jgi:hypothetical protein